MTKPACTLCNIPINCTCYLRLYYATLQDRSVLHDFFLELSSLLKLKQNQLKNVISKPLTSGKQVFTSLFEYSSRPISGFHGASTSKVIGTRMTWLWWLCWLMISRDTWGLSFSDICLTVEEKPRKKPQSGKLTRPGIEPRPARWEATMWSCYSGGSVSSNEKQEMLSFILKCNYCFLFTKLIIVFIYFC